jgi:dTMP kinase
MSTFITFEGGEGSGKSTQIKKIADLLTQKNIPHLLTREPGGTEIGTEIRNILLHQKNHTLSPVAELMLYAADRAQHVEEMIRPALKEGKIVLCDRFADATVAYQGYGRKLDLELIAQLNEIATQGVKPDLTFLLDIPVEIGLSRAKKRLAQEKSHEGRLEAEAVEFHERVRRGYLDLAKNKPKRFCVVDATGDVEKLHQEIVKHLSPLLCKEGARGR